MNCLVVDSLIPVLDDGCLGQGLLHQDEECQEEAVEECQGGWQVLLEEERRQHRPLPGLVGEGQHQVLVQEEYQEQVLAQDGERRNRLLQVHAECQRGIGPRVHQNHQNLLLLRRHNFLQDSRDFP